MLRINEVASIQAPTTGFAHLLIRKSLDAGKETPEAKETKQEKANEEAKKIQIIPEIYSIRGKIIMQGEMGTETIYNSKGEIVNLMYGESIEIKV